MSIKSTVLCAVILLMTAGCASSVEENEQQVMQPTGTLGEEVYAPSLKLVEPRYGHAAVATDTHIYVLGGGNKQGFLPTVEVIDPVAKVSRPLDVKLIARRYHSAVWDGHESIYIFGGMKWVKGYSVPVYSVEVLNIVTHEVTVTRSMPFPRRFNSAVFHKGKAYVAGGETFYPNNVERRIEMRTSSLFSSYDTATKRWTQHQNMPVARSTRALTYQDKVCVVGGYDGDEKLSAFECYDTATKRWELMPDMPYATSAHSVAQHSDKLYVFSDYDHQSQVLAYDFTRSEWSELTLPLTPRRHHAAVVFADEVFVIGGNLDSRGPFLDTIQVFNLPL